MLILFKTLLNKSTPHVYVIFICILQIIFLQYYLKKSIPKIYKTQIGVHVIRMS